MIVSVGCDHGGLDLKETVCAVIRDLGHTVDNHGCDTPDSVDYPDFARSVCDAVENGKSDRGILICGTGIGMSMAANRSRAIRAALCHEEFTARMSREHNDANVLCLGARVVGAGIAAAMVRAWLTTEFAGGRHQHRIDKF